MSCCVLYVVAMQVCVRGRTHVHGADANGVGSEGMKHLGQALQTNHTVTHVTIGGQLLCIVGIGDAGVCVCVCVCV